MTDFIDAVAKRADADAERVAEVLTAHDVKAWTPPPPPGRLTVLKVGFSGVKDEQPYEPFVWEPSTGVWALGTVDNSAGKTTVLNVVRWLLSGRERVDDGARAMIDHAELIVEVADERCEVVVDGARGEVTGTVTVGKAAPLSFTSKTFERTMSSIMLERLGLEPLVGWQKYSGSEDGQEVEFDWASLLPGLFVPEAAYGVVLGDQPIGAGRLLQMFVGLPWYPTHEAIRVASSSLAQADRDVTRRATRDAAVQAERARDLNEQLKKARERARGDSPAAATELQQAAAEQDRTRRVAREQDEAWRAAGAEHRAAEDVERVARRRLRDLQETESAAALFGTLEPARCPRCEQAIDDERRSHEAHGTCSVCDREQPDVADDAEARIAEASEQVGAAVEAVAVARAALEGAQTAAEIAARERDAATDRYRVALNEVGQASARDEARLEVARLEGQLQEAGRDAGPTTSEQPDDQRGILAAAQAEALARMEPDALLGRLNDEVLVVAQRLGLADITAVRLDRGARMAVDKGEVHTTFSKLNLGERLRLKVATVIALLRVGHPSRHPGLIVIDSPAAEEMSDVNLDLMLAEIVKLAADQNDLQVLIATTRTDALTVLPEGHARLVGAGERLW
jgi:hypothetical protein